MTVPVRKLGRAIGVLLLLAVIPPVALVVLLGNPIPAHIPPWSHIAHALQVHIPASVWPHVVAYILWVVWLWLLIGVLVRVAQTAFRLTPRRIPFLGMPASIADQIISLTGAAVLSPETEAREVILRGAVHTPRNHTLDERAKVYKHDRTGVKPSSDLLHYGKLPPELIPDRYREQPDAVWWLDTAIRHLASHFASQGRYCPTIQRSKVSDSVSAWVASDEEPPDPWQSLAGIDGYWTLHRSNSTARRISHCVSVETMAMSRLIPIGEDETGAVVWTREGRELQGLERKYSLTAQAQWLGLVPWIDTLMVVTVGSWARSQAAPAHTHLDTQADLVPILAQMELDDDKRVVIALADEPVLPVGALGADDNLIWVGPAWKPNDTALEFLPARMNGNLAIREIAGRRDGGAGDHL